MKLTRSKLNPLCSLTVGSVFTFSHLRKGLFSLIPLPLFSTDCLFVTEYFTRTPRKLSAFKSFASVELFHFNVPDDTMMAVWNLITFKEQGGTFGDSCPNRNVTV